MMAPASNRQDSNRIDTAWTLPFSVIEYRGTFSSIPPVTVTFWYSTTTHVESIELLLLTTKLLSVHGETQCPKKSKRQNTRAFSMVLIT